MTNEELISSGELELYVAGLLTEERNKEIALIIENNVDIKKEVENIENVVMHLANESTLTDKYEFTDVLKKIITDRVSDDAKVKQLTPTDEKSSRPFLKFAGWAAAAVFLALFAFQFQNNTQLEDNLNISIEENKTIKDSLKKQSFELNYKENMLATITSEDTKIIDLAGQQISPSSSVRVFWDTAQNKVVIDAKTLPQAPADMVYQVWSLKLEPLTPTSLGLLEDYSAEKTLFVLENTNASEGFGITLEPAGGSPTPTLEKLFVLGTTGV